MSIIDQDRSTEPPSHIATEADYLPSIYDCEHHSDDLKPSKRVYRNGQTVFGMQCMRCGAAAGKFVGAAKCSSEHGFEPTVAGQFDEELANRLWLEHREKREAAVETEREARRQEYREYLCTPEWRTRRQKVLTRANFICEGCGEARANEVHHKTYDHVGSEFLFELVALCSACHRRFHGQ